MEWKKIVANDATDKGLISKISKQLIQLYSKKTKNPTQPKQNKTNKKMGRRPKETFLQRRHMCGQQAHKCWTSLIISKIQIKTTMRYHLTLVRMVILTKFTNNKCWRGCGEKENILHCWWECKLVKPLWKTVWRFPRKLRK